MTPIKTESFNRKIKLTHHDLQKLREISHCSLQEYVSNFDLQLKVERLLERIIGRLISINYHVLKNRFQQIPDTYYQSFQKIGELLEIDQKLIASLSQVTGLRNVLAHEYDGIDSKLVFESLGKILDQVPLYLQKLVTVLKE